MLPQPSGTPAVRLHALVVNRTLSDLPVALQGRREGYAWGGHYTIGRCSATILEGELTEDWELTVDGRRVVGDGDIAVPILLPDGPRSVVLDLEIGPAGPIVRGARQGPRPAEPPAVACL